MSKREYRIFKKLEPIIYVVFAALLIGSIGFIAHELCVLHSQGYFN